MYLDAQLSLDPSQLTQLRSVPPTKVFARLLHALTGGRSSPKEEVETFTAVSVLQQLNMAMRGLGITDIVRLARDGRDFYLDTAGRHDDLAEALEAFERRPANERPFSTLKLVLEHVDDVLHYLVEIDIHRSHGIGREPIVVGVSAMPKDLAGSTRDEVLAKLEPIFADQASYDTFVAAMRRHFDAFLVRLAAAIGAAIPSDRLRSHVAVMIVRPRERVADVGRLSSRRILHGEEDDDWARLFHGYHGIDEAFLYAWAWAELAHARGLHLRELAWVDDTGRILGEVGTEGIDAGAHEELVPGSAATTSTRADARVPAASPEDPSGDKGWLGGMFEGGAATSETGSHGDESGCGSCGSG